MKKLFNANILDIFPTKEGFIYASKEKIDGEKEAISFLSYDKRNDKFERIPVNIYITEKYGEEGFRLARDLGDFVTCKIIVLGHNNNVASYPDGTLKIFDDYGIIKQIQKVDYLKSDCSIADPENGYLWLAVPEQNAIIKYSTEFKRVEFRIGSKNEKVFSMPTSPVCYDNQLYICNSTSFKINIISLYSFTVKDYALFNEPIYKYLRFDNKEYVLLESGFYEL